MKLGAHGHPRYQTRANASKHKAMSYQRTDEAGQRLRREVEELLQREAATAEAEDGRYVKGTRGDELPEELVRRKAG